MASSGYSNPSFTTDEAASPPAVGVEGKEASIRTGNGDVTDQIQVQENTRVLESDSRLCAELEPVKAEVRTDSSSPHTNLSSEVVTVNALVTQSSGKNLIDENSIGSHEKSSKEKKSCCMTKQYFYVAIVFSGLSIAFGVAMLAGGYDAMFDAILQTQMEVKPGSTAYDIWKDTPVPLSLSFYLYNLTNPEQFMNGSLPIVEELGPYVYGEFHQKTHLDFNDNYTVTFYQKRWWIWDQEASGERREDDVICVVNTIPISAAFSVRDSPALLWGLDRTLTGCNESLTTYVKVRDTLFDGYEDPLLDLIHDLNSTLLDHFLPAGLMDYDKMAWFYKRNNSETYDGLFNMFTGTDTLDHLGNIDRWNGLQETDVYSEPCNRIFGSAGEIWPPYQTATKISFWCSDTCSTLTLVYKEDITDEFGIDGYRYWADNRTFAYPGDGVPENQCFCLNNDTRECPVKGLMDAQNCKMGSPAYISFPHFLHGDPTLSANIIGMKAPDEERDQLYIDMIPELGVPINVRARMQINIQVTPYEAISLLSNVPDLVMPLLWFEVKAGLTKDLAADLKPVLFLMRTPTMTILWSVMIVGGSAGLAFLAYRKL